jgi:hypothetical protein
VPFQNCVSRSTLFQSEGVATRMTPNSGPAGMFLATCSRPATCSSPVLRTAGDPVRLDRARNSRNVLKFVLPKRLELCLPEAYRPAGTVVPQCSCETAVRRGTWVSRRGDNPRFDRIAEEPQFGYHIEGSSLPEPGNGHGRVAEWFKAAVLKTAVGASPPWVRIPPLPPFSRAIVSSRHRLIRSWDRRRRLWP